MGERYVHVGKVRSRSGVLWAGALTLRVPCGSAAGPPSAHRTSIRAAVSSPRSSESPEESTPTGKDGSHALLTPPSPRLRTAESRWSPLCLRPASTLNSVQEPPFLHHAAPPLGISHLGGRARAAPRPMGRGAVPLRGPDPRARSGLLGRGHRSRCGTEPISTKGGGGGSGAAGPSPAQTAPESRSQAPGHTEAARLGWERLLQPCLRKDPT